ncbi:GGDEF domain-containing protein, partial [Pseudomonas sp. UBA800]
RCALGGQPLSLLMLDVDRFKEYNDKLGHLAGDHALCLVVNTLGKLLRPADSLVRYGGEEFVVLLPEMTIGDARNVAERLRRSLEDVASFHSPIGLLPGVTISIGVAPMRLNDDLDSLINVADRALYRAKEQGRNRVCG